MAEFAAITDAELAQARRDPALRRKLVTEHLERLLSALNLLRSMDSGTDPAKAAQIREGVDLAMRLSNILHRLGGAPAGRAQG